MSQGVVISMTGFAEELGFMMQTKMADLVEFALLFAFPDCD